MTGRRYFALLALAFALLPGAALASTHDHGVTEFFTNVTVAPGEIVDGDVNVVLGDATIAGRVTGNVNVIGGSCRVVDGAEIDGDRHCLWNDTTRAMAPWIVMSAGFGALAEQDRHLFVKFASSAIVVLVFLLFPMRMRLALDRIERHPGISAAVGAVAAVAVVPVAVILAITIIGIPLIVLEIAAIFVGIWLGTGAVSLLVGRRLCELLMPASTPSPLAALLLGLLVVSAAEIVPIVGWAVTALVWLVGVGAAILTFFRAYGTRFALERGPAGAPPMRSGLF